MSIGLIRSLRSFREERPGQGKLLLMMLNLLTQVKKFQISEEMVPDGDRRNSDYHTPQYRSRNQGPKTGTATRRNIGMSYILDALKKSEKERQRGALPDMLTVQDIVAEKPAKRLSWVYLLAAASAA